MNLRKKLLLIMLGAIMVPIIAGISITYFRIQSSIQTMEIDKGKRNLSNVEAFLQLMMDNHKSGYLSWTAWTEYYDAIKSKDIYWINDNILATAEENSNNEVLVVLDRNAKTIAGTNMPQDWKKGDFSKFSLLTKLHGDSACETGLVSTSDGLYIVSVVKVASAEDKYFKNYDGYTVYAMKIRAAGLLEQGKNLLGVKIAMILDNKISIQSDSNMKIELKSSKDIEDDELKVSSRKSGSEFRVETEKILKDAGGVPVGILAVETSSQSGMGALNKLLSSSMILVVILLLSVVIVTAIMINTFIKPIVFITGLMNKLGKGDIAFSDEEIEMMKKYVK